MSPRSDWSAHRGWSRAFGPDRLTLGVILPLEATWGRWPTMDGHLELAAFADEAGFAALWVRDVPLVSAQGDPGQLFEPFTYLGLLSAITRDVALGVASAVLPLRSVLHLAKSALSVEVLSNGRLLLGLATGDRPHEYPAFGVAFDERAAILGARFDELRDALGGRPLSGGLLLVPSAPSGDVPLMLTGRAGHDLEWVAQRTDGWISIPPHLSQVRELRVRATNGRFIPFAQPVAINLSADPGAPLRPGRGLEVELGVRALVSHLDQLRLLGANHAILDLRFSHRPPKDVLGDLAREVLPRFPALT